MTTFNIQASTTSTPTEAVKPWFINTDMGAVKLFPADIDQWSDLLAAIAAGKLPIDTIEVSVNKVDFFHLRDTEELCNELKGLRGATALQLDSKTPDKRYESVGSIYVVIDAPEYFEQPLRAVISILKTSSNELLNNVYLLEGGDVLNTISVHKGEKTKRKALKSIPK